jgi:hypothetical protein
MQAPPSWHARRTPSAPITGALVAAAVAALAVLPAPPPALAAPAAGITITPAGYGPVRLGPLDGPAGSEEHGYCLQARVTASGPADVPVAATTLDDPALAAALARHRFAADDLTQAALGYAAHQRHERPGSMAGGDVAAVKQLLAAATPAAVRDRAADLLAEGERAAGPYQGDPGQVTGQGRRTGVIEGIALRSAAGEPVVGAAFTVTLTGPAVLDASGTATYSGTTTTEPLRLTWTATGHGAVQYRVAFDDVWRTTLTLFDLAGNRQDQLSYGNRPGHDPEQVVVPGPEFPVVHDFRPRATTSVQDVRVQDGDPLVDRLDVAAAPGDRWAVLDGVPVPVPVDVTWYGPFDRPQPQQPLPPPGAPVAGVERVVAHGPGTLATPGTVRATGNGFYTAVATIRRADAGDLAAYVREDFTAPWFEEVETAVNRYDLVHTSQAREFNVVPGGRAADTVVVTGYPADHGEFGGLGGWQADLPDADVTVYGPLPALPDGPEVPPGTPVLWTGTVPARDGVHEVGHDRDHPVVAPTRATHPGGDYFVFVYAFAGDARVAPFVSRFDDVRETFFVPGQPEVVVPAAVVTRAQPQAVPGAPIHDLALVTGTTEDGDHLVFEAFGPQDPAAEAVCDDTTRLWTSDPVPVAGPGFHHSGEVPAPAVAGAVHWIATLAAADGTVRDRGACGIPSETTLVVDELTVATTAMATGEDPVVGVELWDVVTVAGTVPADAVVEVDLFHAPPGEPLVCATPVWTSAPVPLDQGPGEYLTERYATTGPGTYGFVERTTAGGAAVSTGVCGDPAETVTVAAPEEPAPTTAPAPVQPDAAEPGPGAGPLAVTGTDLLVAGAVAVALLVGGVVLVLHRVRVRRALDEVEPLA